MSFFNSILSKLGIGSAEAADAPATPEAAAAAAASVAMPAVDVMSKLEGMAAASAEKLNWKASIVDLLKLLGLDSSLSKHVKSWQLNWDAQSPGTMGDSAQMNIWLHKAVLQKLAQNGGNIPALLH